MIQYSLPGSLWSGTVVLCALSSDIGDDIAARASRKVDFELDRGKSSKTPQVHAFLSDNSDAPEFPFLVLAVITWATHPMKKLRFALQPNGMTDKSTVVGQASFKSNPTEGSVRYFDGTVSYYSAPNAAPTYFTDRNMKAISIGTYSTKNNPTIAKGFMLNGKALHFPLSTRNPFVARTCMESTNGTRL